MAKHTFAGAATTLKTRTQRGKIKPREIGFNVETSGAKAAPRGSNQMAKSTSAGGNPSREAKKQRGCRKAIALNVIV